MDISSSDGSPSYDAWLVDLDGTLYRPKPMKLRMGVQLLLGGLRDLGCIRAFREEHEHLREEFVGEGATSYESPFEVQLQRACDKSGIAPQRMRAAVQNWMIDRPSRILSKFARRELMAEIASFREQGGRTALVSDYPARRKLEGLGATGLFEIIVANGEEGGPTGLKPSPVGYLAAAERLNVPAARCLVIGDRDDADGEAARRAGMGFRRID